MEKEISVYFGLGTNLGNKAQNLFDAINSIDEQIGRLVKSSNFYSSPPFEMDSEEYFWNCCIEVRTTLKPIELINRIEKIELDMGRTQKSVDKKYQNRKIDIDILFYGLEEYKDEKLTIPHPEWQNRLFVLVPLLELIENILISNNTFSIHETIAKIGLQSPPKLELKFF